MKTLLLTFITLIALIYLNSCTNAIVVEENITCVTIVPGDTCMLNSYLTVIDKNVEIYKHYVSMDDTLRFYPVLDKNGKCYFTLKFWCENKAIVNHNLPFACKPGQQWTLNLYTMYGGIGRETI